MNLETNAILGLNTEMSLYLDGRKSAFGKAGLNAEIKRTMSQSSARCIDL